MTAIYKCSSLKTENIIAFFKCTYKTFDKEKYIDILCLELIIELAKNHKKRLSFCFQQIFICLEEFMISTEQQFIFQIIERDSFESLDMMTIMEFYSRQNMILAEMEYRYRYTTDYNPNVHLFNCLREVTEDPNTLAIALHLVEVDQHNRIEPELIKYIKDSLIEQKEYSLIREGTLALIKFREYAASSAKIQENYKAKTSTDSRPNIHIYSEEIILKLMYQILTHFKNIGSNINSSDDLSQLPSSIKLIKVIENLVAIYIQRGYKKNAILAAMLGLKLSSFKDYEWGMMFYVSILLRLAEQYESLKDLNSPSAEQLSKKLEEMFEKNDVSVENNIFLNKPILLYGNLSFIHFCLARNYIQKSIKKLKQLSNFFLNFVEKENHFFKIIIIDYYIINLQLWKQLQSKLFIHHHQYHNLILQEIRDLKEYRSDFFLHLSNILLMYVKKASCSKIILGIPNLMEPYIHMIYKLSLKYGCTLRCLQMCNLLAQSNNSSENIIELEVKF